MSAPKSNSTQQIPWSERDSGGEEEGKPSGGYGNWTGVPEAYKGVLQAKSVHLRLFVHVVLAGVTKAIVETSRLLR